MSDSDLLNLEELASELGVKPGTVSRLWSSGELPSRVVGRVRVTTRGEVESWLDSVSVLNPGPPRPRLPERWTLYRFLDAEGALLYVGITGRGVSRWAQHSKDQPWWLDVATVRVEHFDTLDELASAERAAIRSEDPRYNVAGRP